MGRVWVLAAAAALAAMAGQTQTAPAWRYDAETMTAKVRGLNGVGVLTVVCDPAASDFVVRIGRRNLKKGDQPYRGVFVTIDQVPLPTWIWRHSGYTATLRREWAVTDLLAGMKGAQDQIAVSADGLDPETGADVRHHMHFSVAGRDEALGRLDAACKAGAG